MKIIIGCDSTGINLKTEIIKLLKSMNFTIEDIPVQNKFEDYPDIAVKVCNLVLKNKNNKGILICGTGMGMCIVANKIKKIRATLCTNEYCAEKSRTSNNANILTLGALTTGTEIAKNIVRIWVQNYSVNPKSVKKIKKIKKLEKI